MPETQSPVRSSGPATSPTDASYLDSDAYLAEGMPPLTSSQQEILDMLEGRWSQSDENHSAQANQGQGLGSDVILAAVGASGILAGMALLFFATALGAVVLVLGCLTCTLAFEHALIADTARESLSEMQKTELVNSDPLQVVDESTTKH